MKIPDKLKVAGHHFKVFYDDKYLVKQGILGQCDFISQKIRICKCYEQKQHRAKTDIERTFYHEIVHVIDGVYNNYSLSEKEVDRLATGLQQVMGDNFIVKVKKPKDNFKL